MPMLMSMYAAWRLAHEAAAAAVAVMANIQHSDGNLHKQHLTLRPSLVRYTMFLRLTSNSPFILYKYSAAYSSPTLN